MGEGPGEPCTRQAAFDAGVRIMRAWLAIGVEAHRRFYVLRHGGFRSNRWEPVVSPAREEDARRRYDDECGRALTGAVALYGRGRILEMHHVQRVEER